MGLEKIKRFVFNILKFISVLLVLFTLYICFVPPFGEVPRAERLKIKKVEPSENALTPYNLALKDVETEALQTNSAIVSKIEKALRTTNAVNDELLAFLEKHKTALEHLKEASKLSQYQFYEYSPSFSDPAPNYLSVLTLSNLVNLQSRVFIDKKELLKAQELDLAAYKMANNFALEPNGSLIFSMISEVTRGRAAGDLFYLLTQKEVTKDSLIEIASQLEKMDSRLPDPHQVMMREWKTTQLGLDTTLVEQKSGYDIDNISVDYIPSALKLRIYQGYMQKSQSYMLLLTSALKQWDFESLDQTHKLSKELSSSLLEKEWVDFTSLFNRFNYSPASTMMSLYIGRANSAALRAFAVCGAYEKIHGKFPDTLEQAFDEIGIKAGVTIPIDPVTAQPIGYRLQDGKPVVWFVGKDCQDDGGKKSYTPQEIREGSKGVDIVFFYGELPTWFKPKTN